MRSLAAGAVLLTLLLTPFIPVLAGRDLRVMSYNIRYGTANDGDNHWEKRKDLLIETIKRFNPDLLGTQETLGFQRDYIATRLDGYDTLGVGRDDGRENGEMTALFYRRDIFEKLDGGHFWLSEKPEIPGSTSWDTALTRMVTWVKLRDRRDPKSKPIVFFNTHFDHRGEQARLESARLLRRRIAALGTDGRVVLTGDFNTGEGTDPYTALFAPDEKGTVLLRDAYRVINPKRESGEGSFNGFDPAKTNGPRIDWIGFAGAWQVESATIDHTVRDGHTPSDHFAVTAVLTPRK